ncbi:hypothetical protein SNE40_018381 [Patella caerulea]|uniref:DNA-directed DNA polymerase n=1 Tax=Patella caerulea TaxID=87958 RepID=A0AAN8JB41_PATCE
MANTPGYTLRLGHQRRSRRFHTESLYVNIDFHQNWDQIAPADVPEVLYDTFDNILNDLGNLVDCQPNDFVRFSVSHPGLKTPAWIPFQPWQDVRPHHILDPLARILQSNEEFKMDERLRLHVCHVAPPNGSGSGQIKKKDMSSFEDYLKRKRAIVVIKNQDQLCFQRALVVAKHYANKNDTPEWEAERRRIVKQCGPSSWQTRKTRRLIEEVGGAYEACRGPETWEQYQRVLGPQGYQVNVYSRQLFGKLMFKGTKFVVGGQPKVLHLYHHANHYDVITSMPAFFERNYFCEACQKGYDHPDRHECHAICQRCQQSGPPCLEDATRRDCDTCHRRFPNQMCYDRHLQPRQPGTPTVCQRWTKCLQCGKEWDILRRHRTLAEHVCGEYECSICKKWHQRGDRWCFIQKLKSPIDLTQPDRPQQLAKLQGKDLTRFVFYDFECSQDTGEHLVNLCVLQCCCHFCMASSNPCDYCDPFWNGQREWIFRTLDDVGKWFIHLSAHGTVPGGKSTQIKSTQIIAVAHNFKGYDGLLMLQTIHDHAIAAPQVIMSGGKVMTVTLGTVKFVDSLNFLPMPLRDVPKTFGLTELKKGYFPHFFNKPEHYAYVGSYPPAEDYDPDGMSVSERQTFYAWYQQHKHEPFDFQHELMTYCKSDVDVLRRGCAAFRDLFMMDTGLDPFVESLTLASACNKVFRTHYLEPDTMAIIPRALMQEPEAGKDWKQFRPRQQSNIALRWLEWEQHCQTLKALREGRRVPQIRHARNQGEVRIGEYHLDGYDDNTGYEFMGCAYHGCPRCYPGPIQDVKHHHPYDPSRTMRDLYQHTQDRLYKLRHVYCLSEIKVMWECELNEERRRNPEMEEFFASLEAQGWPCPDPLSPRAGFFGGRTNACQLMAKAEHPDEEIRYVDVVSLYPWVCKYGKFPLKEPKIITRPSQAWEQYEGLIQCSVLPPRQLYHPVLTFRYNGKLTFPLCRSCVEQHMQKSEITHYVDCTHQQKERAWVGTFVSLELKKAVAMGYQVLVVYEVWHWSEWSQYDNQSKSGGLFAGYIDHYLKKKMEASGYPDDCSTDDDKRRFIQDVYDKEGIQLDHEAMIPNKGLRSFSKLQLNTLWGKFGQRDNFTQTVYMTDPADYFPLMMDVTETPLIALSGLMANGKTVTNSFLILILGVWAIWTR